jgi:hypothetical protein
MDVTSMLFEEIESLQAIYGEECIVDVRKSDGDTVVELGFGESELVLRFLVPGDYPASVPELQIEGLSKAARSEVMPHVSETMTMLVGSPMLFPVVEAIRSHTAAKDADAAPASTDDSAASAIAALNADLSGGEADRSSSSVQVVHGEPTVFSKSVFVAHVARVTSTAEVDAVLRELLTNPRIARATHPVIRAYVFTDPATGRRHADNDDDGEDAAGGRLAHLLDLLGVEDCLVVVTRWFGGVLLGPQRFKLINETARKLIEAQPWFKGRGSGAAAAGSGQPAMGGSSAVHKR